VDLIAIPKATRRWVRKRRAMAQIILIQVNGGYAAKPTGEGGKRLGIVARRHGACGILLSAWKEGTAAQFFSLRPRLLRARMLGSKCQI